MSGNLHICFAVSCCDNNSLKHFRKTNQVTFLHFVQVSENNECDVADQIPQIWCGWQFLGIQLISNLWLVKNTRHIHVSHTISKCQPWRYSSFIASYSKDCKRLCRKTIWIKSCGFHGSGPYHLLNHQLVNGLVTQVLVVNVQSMGCKSCSYNQEKTYPPIVLKQARCGNCSSERTCKPKRNVPVKVTYYFPIISLIFPYSLPIFSTLFPYYFPIFSLFVPLLFAYYVPIISLFFPHYFPIISVVF